MPKSVDMCPLLKALGPVDVCNLYVLNSCLLANHTSSPFFYFLLLKKLCHVVRIAISQTWIWLPMFYGICTKVFQNCNNKSFIVSQVLDSTWIYEFLVSIFMLTLKVQQKLNMNGKKLILVRNFHLTLMIFFAEM